MKTASYFGRDRDGHVWARIALLLDDGSESPEDHVNVRVQPGRDAEAAMRLALELFTVRMSTTAPMVAGGSA